MGFLLILFLGVSLRLFGLNWDQGFHLHPDERMLILVADRIHFFDQLNPNFFNYGSLPIYVLKGLAQFIDFFFITSLANYQNLLYLGRFLSVGADVGVMILIYKISQLLFKNKKISLFTMFFYAVAFFPIQNTHFFVVDVFLNLFITSIVYVLLLYLHKSTMKNILILGALTGAAIATKFTAVIFVPVIAIAVMLNSFQHLPGRSRNKFGMTLLTGFIFLVATFVTHFLFMPYAYLDFQKFFADLSLQTKMNSDPYIFPYTLQYVGTVPYLYYLKNIFLWGLGPIISIFTLVGGWELGVRRKSKLFIVFFLYVIYFLIIGRSAVKFMRYMLLLYPFFALMAGYGLYSILSFPRKWESRTGSPIRSGMTMLVTGAALIWTLLFVNIYTKTHTRITATNWILKNIPATAHLAVEHWDDRLPLTGGERYETRELTLYDRPDDEIKWQQQDQTLQWADYIIIASNRLYVPLQKLPMYPLTAQYYKDLFRGNKGFQKVVEFTDYPLFLRDDAADESFTVYDHPKIMIFKKM